jgi:hypothetical protein
MSTLHIFIDESGCFNFSPNGTRYFILTAVSTMECSSLYSGFFELKHAIAAAGTDLEEFHATHDRQAVRDQMYAFLEGHCAHACFSIDSIIAQKNKVNPSIREDSVFYAKLLRILLRWVFRSRASDSVTKVIVWAARIGTNKKRSLFEKTVKSYLANDLQIQRPYEIYLHSSVSHPMLQVADYCCWAVAKKWKDDELRPYRKIRSAIKTEFDVFRQGNREYY